MIANVLPQNAFNKKVDFTTTNSANGNPFSEPHKATDITIDVKGFGDTFQSLTSSKLVIPISNSSANGAPYLKIWLPQPSKSTVYITFATKNNQMADGYYDWINGISSSYRGDLRKWIAGGTLPSSTFSGTLTRSITFDVYGLSTNGISQAIPVSVDFKATFVPTVSLPPSGGGGGTSTF